MLTQKFTNEDSFTSSDSEDLRDIFRSSSSHDRSSVGSIPWAEDAIKQNQQEWERVERMFYGEEELPEEPFLRNEILEWNKAFPQLRVKGRKLSDYVGLIPSSSPDIKEEIIVMHPSRQNQNERRHSNDLNTKLSGRSIGPDRYYSLSNYLEKDLRISSVPMISKRVHNTSKTKTAHIVNKPNFSNITESSTHYRRLLPLKSSGSLFLSRSNLVPIDKPSNSATIIRMPPILIVPHHIQQKHTSATIKRNQRAAIVLPPINLNRVEFTLDDAAKSAGAVTNKQQTKSHVTFSASKLQYLQ